MVYYDLDMDCCLYNDTCQQAGADSSGNYTPRCPQVMSLATQNTSIYLHTDIILVYNILLILQNCSLFMCSNVSPICNIFYTCLNYMNCLNAFIIESVTLP